MQVWLCTRLSDAGESGEGTPGTLFSIPLLRWQELPCQEPHGELVRLMWPPKDTTELL